MEEKKYPFANKIQRRSGEAFLYTIVIIIIATGFCWLVHPFLELSNLAMIYMLAVSLIAYHCGRVEAMAGNFLTVLAFDFFFVPPTFTFAVENLRYTITFAVMLIISFIISTLVLRLRAQSISTQKKERQTDLLLQMSKSLANCLTNKEACAKVSQILASEIGVESAVFLAQSEDGSKEVSQQPVMKINSLRVEDSITQWISSRELEAGFSTHESLQGRGFHLPLVYSGSKAGKLFIFSRTGPLGIDELEYIEGISHLLSATLGRLDSEAEANTAQIRAQKEELRNILLSSISHDLRTPLTAISLSASILEGHVATNSAAAELALEIQESATKLTKIVRNVLDLSRLEFGHLNPTREWHNLEEIIGVSLRRCAAVLQSREIIVDISPSYPMLFLDGLLMEQCLINLLENAARYTPENATIEISAKEENGENVIRIIDNGPGFDASIEPQLFQKMVRGKTSQGIGLGLAICKAVVLAHGGAVFATNRTSGGAELIIRLPIEFEAPEIRYDE